MKKIARHDSASTSQPPSTGPNAVVSAETPAQVPIARPRSSSANEALMIARLLGTSSAPPTPCSARAATSAGRLGASAQASDASGEERDADREHAPPAEAVAGRAADQDQRAEHQHVAVDDPLQAGDASRATSAWIAGSATLTTEPSMNAMLEPRIVAASTQGRLALGAARRRRPRRGPRLRRRAPRRS